MKPHGAYKIRYRRPSASLRGDAPVVFDPVESLLARALSAERRAQRIVASLREEILSGGESARLRICRIFSKPREIFRIELERPDLGYQRTTLLDREALEELLRADDVRAAVETAAPSS